MSHTLPFVPDLGAAPNPRLAEAPRAFSTRRVPPRALRFLLARAAHPRPGDLVLARVSSIGHHTRLQLPDGRRRRLFVGDEIVVAYGHRYAPQQFEARVPEDLGACHLAAAGGIAARVEARHSRLRRGPTELQPIGLVSDRAGGAPVNLADYALPQAVPPRAPTLPTIALVGSSMDSGKTTAAAFLARGLTQSGTRVGYAKVTGTGASGDPLLLVDAGADPVLDFTDVGHASTHRLPPEKLPEIAASLLGHLYKGGVDVILMEVADGVLQPETSHLLETGLLRRQVSGVLFAARDALGATAGVRWLQDRGHRVLGLVGALEAAPLEVREARTTTHLPVFGQLDLSDPATASMLLESARAATR